MSLMIDLQNDKTMYRRLRKLEIITKVQYRVIIVVSSGLPLEGQLMEHVEDIEGEGCLGTVTCRWKPTSTKKLDTTRGCWWADTVTEVHVDREYSTSVENDEVQRASFRTRAREATMAKLVSLAEVFEGDPVEVTTIPLLRQ
jgi:hypothetical protein